MPNPVVWPYWVPRPRSEKTALKDVQVSMSFFNPDLIQDQGGRREAIEAWNGGSLVGNVHRDAKN